jgi:glycosyltransferase involved in cell wall biosynthesis/SAM-dependent methyltransferase
MPSGISDYTTELLPYFNERTEVDVYCPKGSRWKRPTAPQGATLRDPTEFITPRNYEGIFYHLGNNPYHEYIYDQARRRPEIAVFHDAVLHHLISATTIESGDDARYEGILYGEYGDVGQRIATLRRNGIHTDYEKFLFPLTAHVAERARGIVVHSQDAARRISEEAPNVPIVVIPHHAGEPPPEVEGIDREEARRRLRIPQDAFVVGHFGFITRPKQPAAVVNGFWALHEEFPDSLLLMVGADHTGGALERLINQVHLEDSVRIAGYVDLERFYIYLRACDAIINLRYPTAGESSGTLARSLAEGRAVIVNNYASWAELPSDVALKVEIDGPQAEQVGVHLLHLARDPAFRAGVEERSREYARTHLDPNDVPRPVPRVRPAGHQRGEPAHHDRTRTSRARPAGDVGRRAGEPRAGPAAHRQPHRGHARPGRRAGVRDLLYRTILRRPAEPEALRHAHAEMAFGGKLTRAGLARRLFGSREFQEVLTVEQILRERSHSSKPFTIDPGEVLPAPNTTERVVEIPWMLSRYEGEPRVLDTGYAFASGVYLSALLDLGIPSLHGADLAVLSVPGMHRVRADIRGLPYREGTFDLVYCISTIEHVGFDNTRYGLPFRPKDAAAAANSLREMAKALNPHGRLLISVPFGRREERGWMFQYDADSWEELIRESPFTFGSRRCSGSAPRAGSG